MILNYFEAGHMLQHGDNLWDFPDYLRIEIRRKGTDRVGGNFKILSRSLFKFGPY